MTHEAIAQILRDDRPKGSYIRLRMFETNTDESGHPVEGPDWSTEPGINSDSAVIERMAREIMSRADAIRATCECVAHLPVTHDGDAEELTFVLGPLRVAVVESCEPPSVPPLRAGRKPMSNVEFVAELMEFSPAGALSQLVVLQGIEGYCKKVVETPEDELNNAFAEMPISAQGWRRACEHILKRFAERGV